MRAAGNAVLSSHKPLASNASQGKLPLDYFLLAFGLAVPLWFIGGKTRLPLPVDLPAAALVTFVPVTAASIVSYRQSGLDGVRRLWKRALDYRRIKKKAWYLPILFLLPATYGLSYAVMRLVGAPLPDRVEVPLHMAPLLFAMFFIGDAGEELGWTGYAIDPLLNRWGALKASLIFAVVYAFWHAVPFVQTGHSASWVLWQTLSAVPLRVLHVWIYNNAGKSVFAVIVFHDAGNVAWAMFPNNSSHYNPFVTGIITLVTALLVSFGWGAKTLARYRYARDRQS